MVVEQQSVNKLVNYLAGKDYRSLTNLLQEQPELARSEGEYIARVMREFASQDNRTLDYGWQLSGEQLGVIAELRRAGNPLSEFSLRFDYVARLEAAKPKGYNAHFPDLPGCVAEGETIRETLSQARDSLTSYLISKMNHGEQLPQPKYKTGKESKRIKKRKITVTLDDLVLGERKKQEQGSSTELPFPPP